MIIYIIIIISVAIITLLERKLLSIIQRRIGPNIIGYYGILQPFYDGIKSLIKETIIPYKTNIWIMIISPIFVFYIALLLFIIIPININYSLINTNYDILFIIALTSLSIYTILFGGYFTYSKYGFISSIRSINQLISYEISTSFILIPIIIINSSLFIYNIYYNQIIYNNYDNTIISLISFIINILAESNRTPFDLLEAESELIAGFLTEYSSIIFVLYYLAEYSMILFWSFITYFLWNIHYIYIIILIIFLRAILPRFKYNQLIYLSWFIILPINIINYFLYFLFINIILN